MAFDTPGSPGSVTGDVLDGKLLEIENAIVYQVIPEREEAYQNTDNKHPWMVEEMNHLLDHFYLLADRFRAFYAMSLGDLQHVESSYSTLDMDSDTPFDPDKTDYGTTVRATINLGLTRQINPAAYQLDEHWGGDAATGFKAFLLGPELGYGTEGGLQNAAKEHMAYATILATYVHLYRLSALEVLHTLEAIADATLAALLHPDTSGEGEFTASMMLDILGFVPVVGTVANFVSLAKDIGQYAYQKSHQPDYELPNSKALSISGDREHPSRALDAARELVTWLEQNLADEDQKFRDRINGFLTGVSSSMYSATGRSLMVEAPRVDDRSRWVPKGQTNSLVADVEWIYRVGYQSLPGAASYYEEAKRRLDSSPLPSWVAQYYPRSSELFREARYVLSNILEFSGDELARAGDALVGIAKSYQHRDELSAQQLAELTADLAAIEPPAPVPAPPPAEVDGRRPGGDR